MTSNDIKRLREDAGLNQVKFGQLLGVSSAAIGYWERGERKPPQLYEAHMYRLREKLDDNLNDKKEILDTIAKFLIVGGITAFLFWLFSKE